MKCLDFFCYGFDYVQLLIWVLSVISLSICYLNDPNIYLLVEFHFKRVECHLQCTIVRKHSYNSIPAIRM